MIIDIIANNVTQQRYLPFGGTRTLTGFSPNFATDFAYTGQRAVDGSGLMDYKARFYDPLLMRFVSPDDIIPNQRSPQAWNRYSYAGNSPLVNNDPTGHTIYPLCNQNGEAPFWPELIKIIVTLITAPSSQASNASNNASDVEGLIRLGIAHAPYGNITGQGLQDLMDDSSVKSAEAKIVADIKSDPRYGNQAYSPEATYEKDITAGDVNGSWEQGLAADNQAFLMVHTANLYATNIRVSANGTISTTWEVSDTFDYLPAWDDHKIRSGSNYWAYNIGATVVSPFYYGLRHAEPTLPDTAEWNQTFGSSSNETNKFIPQ